MSDNQILELDAESDEIDIPSNQDDYNEQPPEDVVSFNELRSCAELNRMVQEGELTIQPDFQRQIVWSPTAQTRFIDSLAKQLPIPSMCISLDYKKNERLVVDGLQRISTIQRFLSGSDWKLSKLDDIDKSLSDKKISEIKENNKQIYSKIKNLTIPVTVIRCDLSRQNHNEYLFTIFHRLNSGGMKLNNQEIRNCIYSGDFNTYLKEIARSEFSRKIFSIKDSRNKRFAYEELYLRIFAHYKIYESYNGKLSQYLNDFMRLYRNSSPEALEDMFFPVSKAAQLIYERILNSRPIDHGKAFTEALFVAVARNLSNIEKYSDSVLKEKYEKMISDPSFSKDALKEGLSAKDKVQSRLSKAIDIFA